MNGIKRTVLIVVLTAIVVLLAGTALANAHLPVDIDIKPGSCPNSINLNSHGVVPVAILTTDDFDALTVDPPTAMFAGAVPLRWAAYDVDGDGDLDLILHYKTQELVLSQGDTQASLTGETQDGIAIEGMDSVRIVPQDG